MQEIIEQSGQNFTFSAPWKVIEFLTSEDVEYSVLFEAATDLGKQVEVLHTNLDGKNFQIISQCILECYKRVYNFQSTKWVSEKKLNYPLKQGQSFITFKRINSKNETFLYTIANFDQVDFESGYADEYEAEKLVKLNVSTPVSLDIKADKTDDDNSLKRIIDFIRNGDNIFITGHAGTGKSYILGKLKEKYKKKLTITSTTGIAAVNVKGQTLHSWAGVGLCRSSIDTVVEKIRKRASQYRQILNCKMLAIDEVSMLNIETFEYVNEVLKLIRESDEPFGGIQVIFIGDFFQLPPVEKENLPEKRYCFDSDVWKSLDLKNVILKKNYRQNEESFIRALSDMRVNKLDFDDVELLSTRCTDDDTSALNCLHIFSTNEEADCYNEFRFNAIEKPVRTFSAKDGVYRGKSLVYEGFDQRESTILEIFGKNCRAENEIILKEGCRVMLLVNMDFDKGLINGACGTVEGFNEKSVNITFDNGVNANIPVHEFEYYYNDAVAAVRIQYPLRLAYGITIHKSQGMTLDNLVVDCKRVFERGQVYVAMSRVKSLSGLYLKHFDPAKVLTDEKVANFYENLEDSPAPDLSSVPEVEERFEKPDYDDSKIKEIVAECVKEFDGLYGKTGISKALTGSKAIKDNEYNSNILSSHFYGILKGITRKSVDALIDEMISENSLAIKRIGFGRPVLCAK